MLIPFGAFGDLSEATRILCWLECVIVSEVRTDEARRELEAD